METRGTLRPSRVFSIGSRHRSKHGLSLRVAWRSAPTNARLIWVLSRPDLRFYAGHQSRFHYFGLKGSSRRRGSLCGVRLQGSKVEAHRSSLASPTVSQRACIHYKSGRCDWDAVDFCYALNSGAKADIAGGPRRARRRHSRRRHSIFIGNAGLCSYWHQRKEQVPVHVPKFFCPLS